MTDPTERHMAEAMAEPFASLTRGQSCRQNPPCMCVVKRNKIATALAQAERWTGPFSEAVHRLRTAPLAAATPEPEPAADVRAALQFYADAWRGNMIGGGEPHNTYCFQEPTEALMQDAGRRAREALGRRLVERGGRADG